MFLECFRPWAGFCQLADSDCDTQFPIANQLLMSVRFIDHLTFHLLKKTRMKHFTIALFLSAMMLAIQSFTFVTGTFAQSSKTPATLRTADSTQLVLLVENLQAAWNTHDMHMLANLFHEDGTWIVWDGKLV